VVVDTFLSRSRSGLPHPGVVHIWESVGPLDWLIRKGRREEQLALRGRREEGRTRSGGNGKEKEKERREGRRDC